LLALESEPPPAAATAEPDANVELPAEVLSEAIDEEVVEVLADDGELESHQAALLTEIETAEPVVEPENVGQSEPQSEPATVAEFTSEPEPIFFETAAAEEGPAAEESAAAEHSPAAEDSPAVELAASEETPVELTPADEIPASTPWDSAPPGAQPDSAEAPATEWNPLPPVPDWAAAAAAPVAAEAWAVPVEPEAAAIDAWAPVEPEPTSNNDAQWAAPEAPPSPSGWEAPPPAEPQAWTAAPKANTLAQMEGEADPLPVEPGAAQELFGIVPEGGSLSEEDENELPDAEVEDPDLPVAIEEEAAPEASAQAEADGHAGPPEQDGTGRVGLVVPGEHRVAVHTRGGGTRRGVVRDVDLSQAWFTLAPQGGGPEEAVQHDEVKAIFFMLPPGAPPQGGGAAQLRVTFADGRTIEGERDGSEDERGFFMVPTDAARTNTWRIYVARDAIADIRAF
jgi:hypothetical protein